MPFLKYSPTENLITKETKQSVLYWNMPTNLATIMKITDLMKRLRIFSQSPLISLLYRHRSKESLPSPPAEKG
jgi:hypothetical protein